MPEYFIVTVTDSQGKFEVDFQIPSGVEVSGFDKKLLEILKTLSERDFGHINHLQLSVNGRVLQGGETLAEAGVFDGARIIAAAS